MKISIITPTYNSETTLKDTILSVLNQSYQDIEYIIVDGGSSDKTMDIIGSFGGKISKLISEKDSGIYDAMNKGIKASTGEIIGVLNSDDLYADNYVIETVADRLVKNRTDSCYADLVYVDRNNTEKMIRYWRAGDYGKNKFIFGWMPPHPTFFCKRSVYGEYGFLNLDFPLAADYELMLRFLYKHNISTFYIPKAIVKMRAGGTSRPGSYTFRAIAENYRAWKINGLNYPLTVLLKPISKIFQYYWGNRAL
jgi:glycosyltransferase involved in cell wall biosynthesis